MSPLQTRFSRPVARQSPVGYMIIFGYGMQQPWKRACSSYYLKRVANRLRLHFHPAENILVSGAWWIPGGGQSVHKDMGGRNG